MRPFIAEILNVLVDSEIIKRSGLMIKSDYHRINYWGKILLSWDNQKKKYVVLEVVRSREDMETVSGPYRSIMRRNPSYTRQVSGLGPWMTTVLFESESLKEVVDWANNKFNLHMDSQ